MPRVAVGTAGAIWTFRGTWRREDPEPFFPVELTSPAPLRRVSAAKAVAGADRYGAAAWRDALRTGQDGTRGGTITDERRAMCRSSAGSGPGWA